MDQWIYVVGKAWVCQLDDLECCLGSHTLKWLVGVVFIATNQNLAVGEVCWRRAHRTVRCATGQSGAPPRNPFVRAWSWSTVGGFVLMWYRIVQWHTGQSGAPLTRCSDIWFPLFTLQSQPLRAGSRCSAGAPDSPVAHRTVRWIIAELRLRNPKVKSWRLILPGAPDTVRWHTGQSGAPDQGALQFLFAPFFWTLACTFYWFVLNLWHL
jgi:hypothetical protein